MLTHQKSITSTNDRLRNGQIPTAEEMNARLKTLLALVTKIVVMESFMNKVIVPLDIDPLPMPLPLYSIGKLNREEVFSATLHSRFSITLSFDNVERLSNGQTVVKGPPHNAVRITRFIRTGVFGYRPPLQVVEVIILPDKFLGTVTQELSARRRLFAVRNPKGKILARVEQVSPKHLFHKILTPWNTQIGHITRNYYGYKRGQYGFEAFSVDFLPVDANLKIMLLATTFLIHNMFMEGYYSQEELPRQQPR